jgi:hypothetical protein
MVIVIFSFHSQGVKSDGTMCRGCGVARNIVDSLALNRRSARTNGSAPVSSVDGP